VAFRKYVGGSKRVYSEVSPYTHGSTHIREEKVWWATAWRMNHTKIACKQYSQKSTEMDMGMNEEEEKMWDLVVHSIRLCDEVLTSSS